VTQRLVPLPYPIGKAVRVEFARLGDAEILGAVDAVKQRVILNYESDEVRKFWKDPSMVGAVATVILAEYTLATGQGAKIVPELEKYPPEQRRQIVLAAIAERAGMEFWSEGETGSN
jgi:hypothetical protein